METRDVLAIHGILLSPLYLQGATIGQTEHSLLYQSEFGRHSFQGECFARTGYRQNTHITSTHLRSNHGLLFRHGFGFGGSLPFPFHPDGCLVIGVS